MLNSKSHNFSWKQTEEQRKKVHAPNWKWNSELSRDCVRCALCVHFRPYSVFTERRKNGNIFVVNSTNNQVFLYFLIFSYKKTCIFLSQ